MEKNNKIIAITLVILLGFSFAVYAKGDKETSIVKESKAEVLYPVKPVQFAVLTSAGSGQDVFARMIAKIIERPEYLGKPMAILNIPAGGGMAGVARAMQEPADGYFLIAVSNSIGIRAAAGDLPADINDFDYIGKIAQEPFVIAVSAESDYKTIQNLIDAAKKSPGKIKMAGGKAKSTQHIAAMSFFSGTNTDIAWVPYDGQGDAVMSVLGGHTDCVHGNPAIVLPQVEAGKMRVLATSNPERLKVFPDAVTYKELGFEPDLEGIWRGVMAKKGMPPDVLNKLIDVFGRLAKDPEFVEFFKKANAEIIFVEGESFKKSVLKEVEAYKKILN